MNYIKPDRNDGKKMTKKHYKLHVLRTAVAYYGGLYVTLFLSHVQGGIN
jgi:hypothetical protein